MNKKLLLTTIALGAISITWAYAMYGTGQMWNDKWQWNWWWANMHKHWGMMRWHHEQMQKMLENAPANIKAIMEKRKNGQELTDTERETLRDYMKEQWVKLGKHWCKMWMMRWHNEHEREWHHEQMQKVLENAPANIKAIMEKRKKGESITDTEKQTLENYMKEHRPPNMHAVKKYKDMIEKKYWAKLDGMSKEQLTNLQSKIKTLSTTIKDSSNYTEEQKRLYSDVLTALDMAVKMRLDTKNASDIIDNLFNK